MSTVTLLDYGVGNLHSLQKALEKSGASVRIAEGPEAVLDAEAIALPGVGAFGRVMEPLLPHRDALADKIQSVPTLAICVGMQILFDGSDEDDVPGLGVIPGTVRRLDAPTLPHMGWNPIHHTDGPMYSGIPSDAYMYFVHSFAAPDDVPHTNATCEYGRRFSASICSDTLWATQYHPEKSADSGLQLIQNFVDHLGGAA
jgi:glutamine amidotransferase